MNQEPKTYLARAGRSGEDEDRALEHNIAIVGFQDVPSLVSARDYDGIHKIVTKALPEAKPRAAGNFAGQLWAFAVAMKEGDLVVLPRKLTSQIAVGRVTGPYKYAKVDGVYRHVRPVRWRHGQRQPVPRVPRLQTSGGLRIGPTGASTPSTGFGSNRPRS